VVSSGCCGKVESEFRKLLYACSTDTFRNMGIENHCCSRVNLYQGVAMELETVLSASKGTPDIRENGVEFMGRNGIAISV
jgi:hypothetical protein